MRGLQNDCSSRNSRFDRANREMLTGAASATALDEVQASAGARSAPASLLQLWKRSSEGEPRSPLEASPADECASEAQQRAVHTGVAFPADAESAEVVQPGKRPLHNPAHASVSRAMIGSPPRDHRLHAAAPQF